MAEVATERALRIDGVSKRFGAVEAVSDVSLDLGPGELLALVGPSGCGKSTLLRLVAGLHRVESGTIALGGQVVDDGHRALAPERRHVGLVFQDHALFPHLTVGANVGFGLRQMSNGDRAGKVGDVLSMVGLADHVDRFPHELSGGERQRVALARALAPSPTLMLLDEPFASLDPNLRSQVRRDVVEILRATDTPAVFVTHDQAEALAVADRVAVMRAGQLVQVGSPEEVFHRPRTRFVASLLGEAAFLPVALPSDTRSDTPSGGAGGAGPVTPLAGVHCRAEDLGDRSPDTVTAMLRPDDLVVSAAPADGGVGTIESVEFRGATWAYAVGLDSGHQVLAGSSHLHRHPVGSRVTVAMTPGHVPVLVEID